jgi:hypothetical protein
MQRGKGIGILDRSRPTQTQLRQSTLSTSVLKRSGIRGGSSPAGTLHHGHGTPAPPHLQAWSPSNSLSE